MGKTLSSHIIHSLGGEYCWIVRDSEPIRLLKSPRSPSVYILNIYIYIANFLKTNLTKFVVIWVKRRQRLVFSSPRSSKVTVTKQKERREKKAKRRKGGEEKSNACAPSFYNSYLGDFWPKKKPFHANGPFGDIWITWPSVRPSILSDVHYLLVSRGNILHSSAHAF